MTDEKLKAIFQDSARTVRMLASRYRLYVILPMAVCLFLAAAYLVLKSKTYRATQSLAVRDDLLGDSFKPGRYTSLESLKNAQEIISHLARRPRVIHDALIAAFPQKVAKMPHWPNEGVIEQFQNKISVVGSNGAELGKTEVIVLTVYQPSRAAAKAFVEQLSRQIERHLRNLRINQLRSMQIEQEQVVASLERGLADFNAQLKQLEASLGADLGTLRSLLENSSGQNELLRAIEHIRAERRAVQQELERIQKQQDLLRQLQDEPQTTVLWSNDLLNLHPTLKRLFDGLAESQIRLSIERGRYTDQHSAVQAARQALAEVHGQLAAEARNVQQHLATQRILAEQNLVRLERAEATYEAKLAHIAHYRVEYQSLINELTKRTDALSKARNHLLELRSLTTPTAELSLLTPVGEAQADTRPQGPSKATILLFALFGGLAIGVGLVALRIEPDDLAALTHWRNPRTAAELPPRDGENIEPVGSAQQVPEPLHRPSTAMPSAASEKKERGTLFRVLKPLSLRPAKLVEVVSQTGSSTAASECRESANKPAGSAPSVEPQPRNSPAARSPMHGSAEHVMQPKELPENIAGRVEPEADKPPKDKAPPTKPLPGDSASMKLPAATIVTTADVAHQIDLNPNRGETTNGNDPKPIVTTVDAYCPTVKRVTPRRNAPS